MTKEFVRRQLPKDLEGAGDIIQAIFDEHGVSIEREKAKLTTTNEQITALKANITKLEEAAKAAGNTDNEAVTKLQADIAALTAEKEKLTADLTAANEAHEATKKGYQTEKENTEIDATVAAALKTAGYAEASILLFMKAGYDRKTVTRDRDGKFTNAEKFIETLKADPTHATFFGEKKPEGIKPGNPLPGGSGDGAAKDFVFEFTPVRPMPAQATKQN